MASIQELTTPIDTQRCEGFLREREPCSRTMSWNRLLLLCAMVAGAGWRLVAQTPTLLLPVAVAYDAAGDLYVADAGRNQVFEATLAGRWVVIAGSGGQGFSGDGGPATAARLNEPQGVAVGGDGTVYIADTANHRVRAVIGGTIATVAGNGVAGSTGDGGLATLASLRAPKGIAMSAAGDVILCDTGNHRVRRLSGGTITVFAGTGVQGFAGDGGPATAAQLDTPEAVAVSSDGRIFLADAHNNRVRVVSTTGVITTLAGTGVAGYAGDGGLATAARLALPRGVTADADGDIVIADANNQRIRIVRDAGVLTTVAGTGVQGSSVDGSPAAAAMLNVPRGVAISSFNEIAFADTANHAVRVIAANGSVYQPAALVPGRTSTVAAVLSGIAVYGATAVKVSAAGSVATPLGEIQVQEGGAVVGAGTLQSGIGMIALDSLSAGSHALTAQYLGDGLNPAGSASMVAIAISQASTSVAESVATNVGAGASIPLLATVAPATSGVPLGTVTFLDGSTQVASAPLVNGVAQAVYVSPAVGSHSLVASYGGDANFFASLSPPMTTVVATAPVADFALAASGAMSQSVVAGSAATYVLAVESVGGVFDGAVSFGVVGLPAGASASFAPPQLVPGSAGGTTTLTLQTAATVVQIDRPMAWYALLLLPLGLVFLRHRDRRLRLTLMATGGLVLLIGVGGCGDRTAAETSQAVVPQSYTLMVTGTGTSASGSLVSHSTTLTLTVH